MIPLLCNHVVNALQQPQPHRNHHCHNAGRGTTSTILRASENDNTTPSRRSFLGTASAGVAAATFLSSPNEAAWASYIDPAQTPQEITNRVYFDIQIGDKPVERITMGLFGKAMPKTVQNFVSLCESNAYAGTTFYRVLSGMTVQGGAIGDSSGLGKFGTSSFGSEGKTFEPDNFNLQHTQKGLVSMVRGLSGSVDSRFFIQIQDDSGWADDRYAVFGIVENGFDKTVLKIEKVDVKPPSNRPKVNVAIVQCGIIPIATTPNEQQQQ